MQQKPSVNWTQFMLNCGVFGVHGNMMEKSEKCKPNAGTKEMDNALEMGKIFGMSIV
jgi:hypothetical protein